MKGDMNDPRWVSVAWWGLLGSVLLAFAVAGRAQTRPTIAQIRNIEQIKICGNSNDNREGTLICFSQINDGRFVAIPSWMNAPEDMGKPTVCVQHVIRVTPEGIPGYNIVSALCYTQVGLAGLLQDPSWSAWWAIHMNDANPPPADPGLDLVRKLLTSPAIIRPPQ